MSSGKVTTRQGVGEVITAARLNAVIDKHNSDVRGGGQASAVSQQPVLATQRFIITAVLDDYLEGYPVDVTPDGDFIQGEATGAPATRIMKPYKLRKTPFDGQTIAIEGTDITFAYNADNVTRTADDDTTVETQKITPSYDVRVTDGYRGDEILAIFVGITPGFTAGTGDVKDPAIWHDMNTDGRAWAKE
jgi:hypothetical protein